MTSYAHITKTPGVCGGRPCVAGHRVRVQDIVICYEWQGMSPEEICDQFPPLTIAQVHAALAYYFDHRQEILDEIEADRQAGETFKRNHPDSVA
ncbi:MAG: DUF433 domain-containing protein [Planctomycetaceae bacterium]